MDIGNCDKGQPCFTRVRPIFDLAKARIVAGIGRVGQGDAERLRGSPAGHACVMKWQAEERDRGDDDDKRGQRLRMLRI